MLGQVQSAVKRPRFCLEKFLQDELSENQFGKAIQNHYVEIHGACDAEKKHARANGWKQDLYFVGSKD